jgi:hypothetical protein
MKMCFLKIQSFTLTLLKAVTVIQVFFCFIFNAHAVTYFPITIPLTSLNEDITTWSDGGVYSGKFIGNRTLGGTPFTLQTNASGYDAFWGSNLTPFVLATNSSATLTLSTNLYGATKVYTLINSAWGQAGKTVGSLTFNASNGDVYTIQLVEGVNVRDHFYGGFVNTVSSSSVNLAVMGVNTPGHAHLDMQTITLPDSFQNENLTSIVFTSSGGPSTGLPFLAGITVQATSIVVVPSSFSCVETGAAGSNLYTKLANTAFNLDLVALNADSSVDTGYVGATNKNVTMELVDGSGTTACASRAVLSPTVSQALTFTSSNLGRKTSSAITVGKAYSNLRCRVTDSNQSPGIVSCSIDNFAVRPTTFTVASTTATADTTGASVTATPAIKTNVSFNLTATAGAGYNGTPLLDTSKLLAHSGAVHVGSLTGSFTAASATTGIASNSGFAYSEVGYFGLAADGVYDNTFAAVDSANSDCTANFSNMAVNGKYGCNFSNNTQTNYFGRFIPDHLVTSVLSNGSFAHSCSTFTYNGQPLGYGATHPTLNIYAYNASTPASVTQNYTGVYNRLLASQFTFTAPNTDALKKGVDNSNLVKLSAALDTPTLTDNGSGNLTLKLGNDVFTYQRENNALIAPFSNAIAVTVYSVADSDNVTATTLPMVLQPAGENIYYGRVNLVNANGSELLDLPMPLTAEYWNGTGWIKNVADQCTTGITFSTTLVTGPLATLCVWDTGVSTDKSGLGCSTAGTSINKYNEPPLVTDGGNFNLNFKAPGVGNTGAMDIMATVPSYLMFNWKGTGNANPIARATFGIYKGNSHIIYIREVY